MRVYIACVYNPEDMWIVSVHSSHLTALKASEDAAKKEGHHHHSNVEVFDVQD